MQKKDDLQDRLFKGTLDFKDPQIEASLPNMNPWEFKITDQKESQFFEKREHFRGNVSIHGIFETVNEQFRASTKNVSMGGVLIDPETDLILHEDLYMTFSDSKFNGHIRTKGKVVRIESDGVGIQFDRIVPIMSSL